MMMMMMVMMMIMMMMRRRSNKFWESARCLTLISPAPWCKTPSAEVRSVRSARGPGKDAAHGSRTLFGYVWGIHIYIHIIIYYIYIYVCIVYIYTYNYIYIYRYIPLEIHPKGSDPAICSYKPRGLAKSLQNEWVQGLCASTSFLQHPHIL